MRAAALLLLTIMVSRAAAGGGGSAPMVPLLRLSGGGEATSGEGMNFEGIKAALDDAPGQRSGIKSGERKRRFMEGLPDSPPDDDGAIAELGAGMKGLEARLFPNAITAPPAPAAPLLPGSVICLENNLFSACFTSLVEGGGGEGFNRATMFGKHHAVPLRGTEASMR
jgi:hypothetical protein